MVLDSNFKEFIALLNANGVKYLVVGGFAVAFHGYPRYTKDIDFWIWADPENADRMLKTLSDFGFGMIGVSKEDFLDTENIIQLGHEPNRIDLITQLEGMPFEACYAVRQEAAFEGVQINFIDIDNLIKSKQISGSQKDLLDASELEKQKKNRK
jgi:Nucleotidyl transferase of unknown function (DUF2204)